MSYLKPPLKGTQHIELLKSRGLQIADEDRAAKYLETIGYYRLSGYMFHLQRRDKSHKFFPGTTFDEVVNAYKFDKKLRAIVLEYMERIEVALRTKLTNVYSLKYGFFWYTRPELFSDAETFAIVNDEISERFREEKELFVKTFKLNHPGEKRLPSPMAMEVMSLGKLARLYKGLESTNTKEKKQVASEFGLIITLLETWIIWLTNVRNICAHHARLWNRLMTPDKPHLPVRQRYSFNSTLTEDNIITCYGAISLIHRMLEAFNPNNSFVKKVEALINEYGVNAVSMGFPPDWKTTATWHQDVR